MSQNDCYSCVRMLANPAVFFWSICNIWPQSSTYLCKRDGISQSFKQVIDMNKLKQWPTYSNASFRKGWMIERASSRQSNKAADQQVVYSKTSARAGWSMNSAGTRQLEELGKPVGLGSDSEAVVVSCHWLSAHQVDTLAEYSLDWISPLPNSWPIEVQNFSLLGVESFQNKRNRDPSSVDTLVQITQQADYYPVVAPNGTCWSYSCCLHLPELGRVRFVVCFQDSQRRGEYAAFVTNRLDWSPRKVIFQCSQLRIWPSYMGNSASSTLN